MVRASMRAGLRCGAVAAITALFATQIGFAAPPGGGGLGPQLQRTMNNLPTTTNYFQYSQVTGVKPIIGTVTIYNQFGTSASQGGLSSLGGLSNNTLGGAGSGQASGNIPGLGASQGGDDPPAGVLLHVQYAQMFLPNQQQINNPNGGNNGANALLGAFGRYPGYGGFPGYGGGFGGKGFGQINGFGNGGSGL